MIAEIKVLGFSIGYFLPVFWKCPKKLYLHPFFQYKGFSKLVTAIGENTADSDTLLSDKDLDIIADRTDGYSGVYVFASLYLHFRWYAAQQNILYVPFTTS